MANKIEVVIQHALRTFSKYIRKKPEFSPTDLHELQTLANDVTSTDIHRFRNLLKGKDLSEFMRREKTTLDYVPVYEDDCITVGVFLLKEGAKLPIHDHPNMYGIIKVLEGILKVTSYSFVEFDKSIPINDSDLYYNFPLKVTKHPEVLLGSQDNSCLLTPTERNIHEVECVVGPAAFLDILSPPYEDGSPNQPRVCHYFEEVSASEDSFLRLVQVERSL